jgi:Na+/proline symporter
MKQILSPIQGVILLVIYGALMIGATLVLRQIQRRKRADTNMPEFLLANRGVGVMRGAMSIAASWIWAPALFVSSQKAFEQGLPGAFWFIFPNLLALVVFAPFALKVRKLLPKGYTLPQLIRERHGTGVHRLYMVQFIGLQLCSFAVQILGGATLIQVLSGLPFIAVGLLLVTIVLIYAVLGGLRASVMTDYIQMATILTICAVTIPWAISMAGGASAVAAGFAGASGSFGNIFDPWIFYSFGISTTIGLLSGPIGDQMHWQRAYAIRSDRDVIKTFWVAACLFVIVPLSLTTLGFIAAGNVHSGEWAIKNAQLVGANTVSLLLPGFMLVVFAVMVLSGLCATLDSILCAISSLTVVDLFKRREESETTDANRHENLKIARCAMIVAALVGLGIASIPGLKILHLFLFYGTLRASTLIPTVLTLLWPKLQSRAVFFAVMLSLMFGAPVLAIGEFMGNPHLRVLGSLLVVTIGLTCCVGLSKAILRKRQVAS